MSIYDDQAWYNTCDIIMRAAYIRLVSLRIEKFSLCCKKKKKIRHLKIELNTEQHETRIGYSNFQLNNVYAVIHEIHVIFCPRAGELLRKKNNDYFIIDGVVVTVCIVNDFRLLYSCI